MARRNLSDKIQSFFEKLLDAVDTTEKGRDPNSEPLKWEKKILVNQKNKNLSKNPTIKTSSRTKSIFEKLIDIFKNIFFKHPNTKLAPHTENTKEPKKVLINNEHKNHHFDTLIITKNLANSTYKTYSNTNIILDGRDNIKIEDLVNNLSNDTKIYWFNNTKIAEEFSKQTKNMKNEDVEEFLKNDNLTKKDFTKHLLNYKYNIPTNKLGYTPQELGNATKSREDFMKNPNKKSDSYAKQNIQNILDR